MHKSAAQWPRESWAVCLFGVSTTIEICDFPVLHLFMKNFWLERCARMHPSKKKKAFPTCARVLVVTTFMCSKKGTLSHEQTHAHAYAYAHAHAHAYLSCRWIWKSSATAIKSCSIHAPRVLRSTAHETPIVKLICGRARVPESMHACICAVQRPRATRARGSNRRKSKRDAKQIRNALVKSARNERDRKREDSLWLACTLFDPTPRISFHSSSLYHSTSLSHTHAHACMQACMCAPKYGRTHQKGDERRQLHLRPRVAAAAAAGQCDQAAPRTEHELAGGPRNGLVGACAYVCRSVNAFEKKIDIEGKK